MTIEAGRKLALVTGASAGIGVAFARQLAADGHDVILVARRLERLEALAAELSAKHGVAAIPLRIDLSLPDAREKVAAALEKLGRKVDVLVNNAGFSTATTYAATPWERESAMIMTLMHAVASLTHLVLPDMLARGQGRIINVASVVGFAPGVAGHTLYPAAKSFVIKFTQSLDCEVRAKGIKVTALCPGFTETEFQDVAGMSELAQKSRLTRGDDPALVVAQGLSGNLAGKVIVVTGMRNKLSRFAMKVLPEGLTRPLINYGARKFRKE